ncbi:unnamed protein product, partial [Vitrella brassicaformis CCMP3155]
PFGAVEAYHGGRGKNHLANVESKFASGALRIVVATSASCVNLINTGVLNGLIYYSTPQSFEALRAELTAWGSACQDAEGKCHVFLRPEELMTVHRATSEPSVDPWAAPSPTANGISPVYVENWYRTTISEDPKDIEDWPNFDDDPVVFMWKLWEMKVHFIDRQRKTRDELEAELAEAKAQLVTVREDALKAEKEASNTTDTLPESPPSPPEAPAQQTSRPTIPTKRGGSAWG